MRESDISDKSFESPGFVETNWKMVQDFTTIDEAKAALRYSIPVNSWSEYEGPFLKEERDLIRNFSKLITGYINSLRPQAIPDHNQATPLTMKMDINSLSSRKLLQKFLDRHNAERDVFHDLMPFMVREILLVASLYDAYSIEGEGRFSDHMLGEYYQMSLTSLPRVTGVSGEDEAFYAPRGAGIMT
ncbi:MAG: hypothetical protein MZV63_54820 [Marinilabiliales bacterium]|nr:hypothetical protein [Marinilabiliales bacterium]